MRPTEVRHAFREDRRLALCVLAVASVASAQESGIRVRSIRVLATDPEAVAAFYEKAFGMSETRRAANTATFKEIVINSGSTVEMAKKATSTPLVIATRSQGRTRGRDGFAILEVPDLEKAIAVLGKGQWRNAAARAVDIRGGPPLRVPQGCNGWVTKIEIVSRQVVAVTDGCQTGVRSVSDGCLTPFRKSVQRREIKRHKRQFCR